MPNWCECTLEIYASDEKEMSKFADEALRDGEFSLSNLYPIPEDLEIDSICSRVDDIYEALYGDWEKCLEYPWAKEKQITTQEGLKKHFEESAPGYMKKAKSLKENFDKHGYTHWYTWCINEWGTKWDVNVYHIDWHEDYARIEFGSAWSPPRNWLEYVAKKYPEMQFSIKYDEPGLAFMGVIIAKGDKFQEKSIDY